MNHFSLETLLIFIHAVQIAVYDVACMPRACSGCVNSLGFVKSTSSIGCDGAESNAPVYSNSGEHKRPCTSGINYFGAEDGTSVKSSTCDPSRPSCPTTLEPQQQQCTGDCCSACRIALEAISEYLNLQIFLGKGREHAPTSP